MESVSNILGIDKVNMGGKVILIEEQHDSNANFLFSAIVLDALKKNYGICFILLHNTFNHYYNVGIKFGYNFALLKEKGVITFIEPMKIIVADMEYKCEETIKTITHILFATVRDEYNKMKTSKPVIIIIDDLSHLCNFGFNLKQCMYYVRYLRSLIEYDNISQLCITTHTYKYEVRNCPNAFIDGLKYIAHLFVAIESFKIGYSSDTAGKIIINWRIDSIRSKHNWPEVAKYVYKLSDRQVQIYSSNA